MNVYADVHCAYQVERMANKRLISELVADDYPISVIARKIGVSRSDVYCFLTPTRYHYRLTEEKLRLIAEFEGRSLRTVREEYERKAVA